MMAEFGQVEAQSMILNNDQGSDTGYGGSNGLRGLNQYAYFGAYSGGTVHPAAYGTSGVASTDGLSTITTYDQITTNGTSTTTNNITYKDVINFIYSLPNQYWTENAKFMINPIQLQAIRGLVDDQKRPIYIDGLARTDGIVGQLLGFDVVVNKYCDTPNDPGTSPTANLYPMFFGDWTKGHCIVDRLNMVLRRYDQTQPGFITFYGEKRLCSSVVDPLALVAYRSTHTAD
jgi:HK97 family phage major capsid protein